MFDKLNAKYKNDLKKYNLHTLQGNPSSILKNLILMNIYMIMIFFVCVSFI